MYFSGDNIERSLRRDYCGSGGPTPNAAGGAISQGGGTAPSAGTGGSGKNDATLRHEAQSATPTLAREAPPSADAAPPDNPFANPSQAGASVAMAPAAVQPPTPNPSSGSPVGPSRDVQNTINAFSNPNGYAKAQFIRGFAGAPDGTGFLDRMLAGGTNVGDSYSKIFRGFKGSQGTSGGGDGDPTPPGATPKDIAQDSTLEPNTDLADAGGAEAADAAAGSDVAGSLADSAGSTCPFGFA